MMAHLPPSGKASLDCWIDSLRQRAGSWTQGVPVEVTTDACSWGWSAHLEDLQDLGSRHSTVFVLVGMQTDSDRTLLAKENMVHNAKEYVCGSTATALEQARSDASWSGS